MGDEAQEKQGDNNGDGDDLPRDDAGRFLPGAGRWKPGQSGNPAGRPKHRTVSEALTEQLEKPASALTLYAELATALHLDPETVTVRELIAHAMIVHGVKGQPTILTALIDRIDGKVADRIAGHDGGPLQVQAALDLVLSDPETMKAAAALANRMSERGNKERADAAGTDDGDSPHNE